MKRLTVPLLTLGLLAASAPAAAYDTLDNCDPTWSTQPSPWWLNSAGYSEIPIATLETLFTSGFAEWSRPCCSSWEAVYRGRTGRIAEDASASENILSFQETRWPTTLGDGSVTLAVTLTTWQPTRTSCTNLTADMVFNGVNHTFGTSDSRTTTDLLAVTVHEQGHWLGLDHSSVNTATMYFSYFGEDGRSLHPDDENGVCYLYPDDCACSTNADCEPGEQCIDSACVVPPCTSDADCDVDLACDPASGLCIEPPCTADSDCIGAQVCIEGACVIEADCSICQPCSTADDCGGTEFVCAGADATTEGICTKLCDTDADCPGDSLCWAFEGEDFQLCLNPDADTSGVCDAGYVCTGIDACDGVTCGSGEVCNPATGACEEAPCIVCETCNDNTDCPGGSCYGIGTGNACMVECGTDADCPVGTACEGVSLVGGGSVSLCLVPDSTEFCPADFVCGEAPDLCAAVDCDPGQVCDPATGDCVGGETDAGTDTGSGTDTSAGWPGDCAVCAPCEVDGDCGPGGDCVDLGSGNVCIVDCSSSACPGNTECFDVSAEGGGTRSICLNDDAATAGVCPSAFVCDSSAGSSDDTGSGGEDTGTEPDVDGSTVGDDTVDGTVSGFTQSGCAAGHGNGALAGLGLLGLLGLARRRRR